MSRQQSEPKKEFKGIWIPKEIWQDERLNALDKILLCEIDSLTGTNTDCYASNRYLAKFCQCSESKISKSIAKLTELGYIYVKSFDRKEQTPKK